MCNSNGNKKNLMHHFTIHAYVFFLYTGVDFICWLLKNVGQSESGNESELCSLGESKSECAWMVFGHSCLMKQQKLVKGIF